MRASDLAENRGVVNSSILDDSPRARMMVARERFELSSAGPKPAMLDHYTTGLQSFFVGNGV